MIEKIEDYARVVSRFHMPGHSGVDIDGGLYSVAKYDITELDFSDNLHSPTGDIKEIEDRLAEIYSSRRALMLTEGATSGIHIALLIAREMRGTLYLLGDTHKSCIAYASIIGLKVIALESMDDAIARVSAGDWVYVTTPNYYGAVIDLDALLEARANGGAVIVDEAHGAHFVFSELLPVSNSGRADLVVESLHKTMPVFTGGAVLNVNNARLVDMAVYFRTKVHTTSPSYLIMESIDYATRLFRERGEEYYRYILAETNALRDSLDERYEVEKTADFSRVVIRVADAEAVEKYLESHGIYIEMSDEDRLVLIVTPFNVDRLGHLAKALADYQPTETVRDVADVAVPTLQRAIGTAGALEFVPLRDSVGKVSMTEIAIYPPGVPVVRSGDIITSEAVEYIESNIDRIVGIIDGTTIAVREICEED